MTAARHYLRDPEERTYSKVATVSRFPLSASLLWPPPLLHFRLTLPSDLDKVPHTEALLL